MKAKIAAVVAVLMLPVLFGFVLATPVQATTTGALSEVTWLKGAIDNESNVEGAVSIAVDASGYSHISYYDQNTNHLMYATNVGGYWSYQTIGSSGSGSQNAIALDSNGNAYIAYYDASNNRLMYATDVGGSWKTSTVDAQSGQYLAIAVDSSGISHIAYQSSTSSGYVLKYATNVGGSWITETIDHVTGAQLGYGTSIAIGPEGKIYVSSVDINSGQLRFAAYINDNWTVSAVSNTGSVGPATSIAVDSFGIVHVSYFNTANHRLNYIIYDSGSWSTPVVIDNTVSVTYSSITIDANDNVHITYYDADDNELRYATNESKSWKTYLIDSSYDMGIRNSIAVDPFGKIYVAYIDNTHHYLMFATSSNASWSLSTIASGTNKGSENVIAIDQLGNIHIAYYDESNNTLMYTFSMNSGETWETQSVDVGGMSPSIAVNPEGFCFISYVDSRNGNSLKFATNINGYWTNKTIDSTSNFGESSIGVDANSTVYISYYDISANNLKFASNANGSWSINVIDSSASVKNGNALVVDSSNKVHIIYNTASGLKIITNKADTWKSTAIDSESGTGGSHISAVIGDNGTIHVSYFSTYTNTLNYAIGMEGSWSIMEIGSAIGNSSIGLNSAGEPRIAYEHEQSGSLNTTLSVAEMINGKWMISDVDINGVGPSMSMALDEYNRLHISYYSERNTGLEYAVSVVAPSEPTNLNGTRGDQTVRLTWIAPDSNGGANITNFYIYRGNSSNDLSLVAEVSGNIYVYDDNSVNNGNTLYYQVVAVNSEGTSIASHELSLNPYSTPSTTNNGALMLLIIAGVIGVVAIAVVVILVMRKVKPKNKWKQ
jgi:hypothetical protein